MKTKVKGVIKAAVSYVCLWPRLVLQSESNYCGVWYPSASPWRRGCQFGCQTEQDHLHLTDVLSQLRFILPKWLRKGWNLVPSISALCQRMCCSVLAMKTCSVHFSKVFIKNQLDDPSTYVLAYYEWTCMLFFRYRGYLKCLCIN